MEFCHDSESEQILNHDQALSIDIDRYRSISTGRFVYCLFSVKEGNSYRLVGPLLRQTQPSVAWFPYFNMASAAFHLKMGNILKTSTGPAAFAADIGVVSTSTGLLFLWLRGHHARVMNGMGVRCCLDPLPTSALQDLLHQRWRVGVVS